VLNGETTRTGIDAPSTASTKKGPGEPMIARENVRVALSLARDTQGSFREVAPAPKIQALPNRFNTLTILTRQSTLPSHAEPRQALA
jgi:hypothetical protein